MYMKAIRRSFIKYEICLLSTVKEDNKIQQISTYGKKKYTLSLSLYSIGLYDLRRKISGNTVLGRDLTLKFPEF
jgi:hypothetical protein